MLDLSTLTWKRAHKTAPVSFKHVTDVLRGVDYKSFLVNTMEGAEQINPQSMLCRGIDGEYWLQWPDNLFASYDVTGVSPDGWYTGTPKAAAVVSAAQIALSPSDVVTIRALWGEKVVNQAETIFVQRGTGEDWVCRSLVDPDDVWIVKSHVFARTYEIQP